VAGAAAIAGFAATAAAGTARAGTFTDAQGLAGAIAAEAGHAAGMTPARSSRS